MEESGKQENAHKCDIANWRDRLALLWWRNSNIEANEQHTATLADRGPEKGLAPTKSIREEEKKDSAADTLNDTVDAGGEETRTVSSDTDVLENQWCIVVDSIGTFATLVCIQQQQASILTSHLLANHQDHNKDGSFTVAWDQPHFFHESPKAGSCHKRPLVLELCVHV